MIQLVASSEELEQDFSHFPKYHRILLLGVVNANWGEGTF
jgi:hypothetical protein